MREMQSQQAQVQPRVLPLLQELSNDEYSVLWGVFHGKSVREIWAINGRVSIGQIRTWRKAAMRKIGARDKYEAFKILWEAGWR